MLLFACQKSVFCQVDDVMENKTNLIEVPHANSSYELIDGVASNVVVGKGYQPVAEEEIQHYLNRGFSPSHALSACLACALNDPNNGHREEEFMMGY